MSTIILSLQWSLHYYGDLKSAMALCYDRVALYSREDMLSRFRIYPASFSKYASACNTHGTHIVHAS